MPTLKYDFSVVGLGTINRALSSLEKRLQQHNSRVNRTLAKHGSGTMGRTRSPGGAAASANKQARVFSKRQEGWASRLHSKKMADLGAEERAEVKSAMKVHRIRRRNQLKRAKRAAADTKRLEVIETRRRRGISRGVRGGARRVGSGLRSVGRAGASMLGIGAGLLAGDAAGREMSLDKQLRAMSVQIQGAQQAKIDQKQDARFVGKTMGLEERRKDLRGAIVGTATRTGVSSLELAGGVAKFQELTGRGDLASQVAPQIAKIAQITNATMEDVAATMAFTFVGADKRAKSTGEAMKSTLKIMNNIGAQGMQGMIEFSSLAPVMGKVVSASAGMEGKFSELIPQLVALGQMSVEGGAANAAEAATALMRLRDDIMQLANKKTFQKVNQSLPESQRFDPYTWSESGSRTGLKGPMQIIESLFKMTKGDLPTMGRLFGTRGKKPVEPVFEMISRMGKGNVMKGIEAARKRFAVLTKAQMSQGQMERAATFVRGGTSTKLGMAMEKFRAEAGPQLARAIETLIPSFIKLAKAAPPVMKAFANLVGFLSKNPFTGLGLLVSGFIIKELAAAGFATIGAKILAAVVASSAGAGAAGAAGAGAAGAAGAGAAGAAGAGGIGVAMKAGLIAAAPVLTTAMATGAVAAVAYNAVQLGNEANDGDGSMMWNKLQYKAGAISKEEWERSQGIVQGADWDRMQASKRTKKMGAPSFVPTGMPKPGEAGYGVMAPPTGNLSIPGTKESIQASLGLQKAASVLTIAAGKLSKASPNRGNSPTKESGDG